MGLFDSAKGYVKKTTDSIKNNGNLIKELQALPMEERIKQRNEGVVYCLVNSLGKIMDVYEDKVVMSSLATGTSVAFDILLSTSTSTHGDKTIYYRNVLSVQFKPSGAVDGFIQLETANTGSGNYAAENSYQFGKSENDIAKEVADYIQEKVEETNKPAVAQIVQKESSADELIKFKQLLDMGAITQEEFDAKKKELLGL